VQHSPGQQNVNDNAQRKIYETIICQHYESIYNFMLYLTNNAGLAEDLTQETFASAWVNINSFRHHASLKTWLHRIAYCKFIDSLRRQKRDIAFISNLQQEKYEVTEPSNPLKNLIADEDMYCLYKAMHRLKLSDYVVLVLHYIQNLSFREMSKVLDEPGGTVKWRTNKALKALKGLLAGGETL